MLSFWQKVGRWLCEHGWHNWKFGPQWGPWSRIRKCRRCRRIEWSYHNAMMHILEVGWTTRPNWPWYSNAWMQEIIDFLCDVRKWK